MANLAPAAPFPAADRMRRIRESLAIIPEAAPEVSVTRVWAELGILRIPAPPIDELPHYARRDRAALRSYVARQDWKERCKRKRRISPKFRRWVIDNADARCEYCGIRLPAAKLEIDHIVPVARGGRSYFRNLAASCGDCNFSKFDYLIEEWLPKHHAELLEVRLRAVRKIFPDAFRPRPVPSPPAPRERPEMAVQGALW